ncbi:cytochrome c oxidase subunit 3 [Micromonospora polyrhachis]|uniref:cytochrome-c oxidase n=1 Tax=Micromonospora polyrhachis TaxID=1282883 RepID=A0A7W7SY78_9ACTN|nr:cytochrome c oxidase subunit 3 [Micromonospora polyrhachis]MBB4962532.1 heme/copper-type cytochrome/quinol oxidase subunit 3 [Micromonospora polyrhachis]
MRGGVAAVTEPAALATELPAGRSTGWWGMALFIATESTLFAALLGSYFYLRFQAGPQWPPAGIRPPELFLPLIMTALLLPSSLPLLWAERGIRRGQQWRLRAGLAATIALGASFLSLQAMEYASSLEEFTFTTDVYGSLYYVITGFHGAHVTIGLLMLTWLLAAALRGKFGVRRHERVRIAALYWHFVDLVWAAILFTVYLSPRL